MSRKLPAHTMDMRTAQKFMHTFSTSTAVVIKVSFGYLSYLKNMLYTWMVIYFLVLRWNSKSNFLAELTVSVGMPKSEFTEAAHRQRQAWQGAIVHLHHHLHHHPSICTIVGTIIHPSIAERRDAEEANSGLAKRLAVAGGHEGMMAEKWNSYLSSYVSLAIRSTRNLNPTLCQWRAVNDWWS